MIAPLARVLIAADPGNGISSALDYRRFIFINPDMTVNPRVNHAFMSSLSTTLQVPPPRAARGPVR